MAYTVYVLKSKKNGRRYVGCTKNLKRRLKEHNTGQSTYTRHTGPYKLIYKEEYAQNKIALRRERYLKSGKGRSFLDQIEVHLRE